MPRGGARPGSGRKKGQISKGKLELASMAREYADVALKALVEIAEGGESEPARVSASAQLLDRGYGRPPQALHHSGPDGGPMQNVVMSLEEAKEEAKRRGLPTSIFDE